MAEEFDAAGTADPFGSADLQRTLAESLDGTSDTDDQMQGATAEEEDASTETLLDPATLPDELKPHWSRMSKAHNTRLNELRSRERGLDDLEQKAAVVDRFYSDPAYARQVIEQMGPRLGLSIGAGASPQGQPQHAQTGQVPGDILQAAEQALADTPDIQFLAPHIAKVAHTIAQKQLEPFQQQHATAETARKQAEYDQMSATLSEHSPGWEEHEDEMLARLGFLRAALNGSGPMVDRRYGSVLDMLYRWTTGEARATTNAARRMTRALHNRTTTGSTARSPQPNLQEQIIKTEDDQEKWAIAFRDALRQAQSS